MSIPYTLPALVSTPPPAHMQTHTRARTHMHTLSRQCLLVTGHTTVKHQCERNGPLYLPLQAEVRVWKMDAEHLPALAKGNMSRLAPQPLEKQGRSCPWELGQARPKGPWRLSPLGHCTSPLMASPVSWHWPSSKAPSLVSLLCLLQAFCCGHSLQGTGHCLLGRRAGNGMSHSEERHTESFPLEAREPLLGFLCHGRCDPEVALLDQGSPQVR